MDLYTGFVTHTFVEKSIPYGYNELHLVNDLL